MGDQRNASSLLGALRGAFLGPFLHFCPGVFFGHISDLGQIRSRRSTKPHNNRAGVCAPQGA